jgi:membrane-bound lytic murein transglycosylase F
MACRATPDRAAPRAASATGKKALGCFLLALVALTACAPAEEPARSALERRTVQDTSGREEIVLITRPNSSSYYHYGGKAMGFDHDLAKAFALSIGARLRVIIPEPGEMVSGLLSGRGDIIAANIVMTSRRKELMAFSDPLGSVQMQLVAHRNTLDIASIDDLKGRTVYVRAGTDLEEELMSLKRRGYDFHIDPCAQSTEELLRMVNDREIELTVAHSNLALLSRRYYPNAEALFPLTLPLPVGWAVRNTDRRLLAQLNAFLQNARESGLIADIHNTYYANIESFDYMEISRFHSRIRTRLPKYRDAIIRASERHGLDWRLVAAVIYQESQFNPQAASFTGVRGLMQLSQAAASEMGISNRDDPVQSINAGVGYLKRLYDGYTGVPEADRMCFALAAYNVGPAHVEDAMRIADEMGLAPNKWSSIRSTLPLLTESRYYSRATYGYCRGLEPVRYVKNIHTYYDVLRQKVWSL